MIGSSLARRAGRHGHRLARRARWSSNIHLYPACPTTRRGPAPSRCWHDPVLPVAHPSHGSSLKRLSEAKASPGALPTAMRPRLPMHLAATAHRCRSTCRRCLQRPARCRPTLGGQVRLAWWTSPRIANFRRQVRAHCVTTSAASARAHVPLRRPACRLQRRLVRRRGARGHARRSWRA